jgi:hypothetical protein
MSKTIDANNEKVTLADVAKPVPNPEAKRVLQKALDKSMEVQRVMTDANSESELSKQVHEVLVRTAFHFETNGYKYEDLQTSGRIREFTEEIMAIVEAWQHQQLEAKVADAQVKELEWAMYSIGDLHMERIGSSDFDNATSRVEADRRQHHKIIEDRIAHLTNNKKET